MADFDIVNASTFLNLKVDTYDEVGHVLPDDGRVQRRGAETQYVFAEFLLAKGLLHTAVDVTRQPNLTIKFSALTEQGQAFARAALDPWMRSLDRNPKKPVEPSGLERRWQKFIAN
ncbi:MAG TPA: hypothetical protein VG960_05080 [Caulobacteraceae bacterium]|nr:hypothetical protein [Caulobacteraceae bacterium]